MKEFMKEFRCKQCGISFFRKKYLKRTYCGRECQMKATLHRGRGKLRDYTSITGKNNYAWKGQDVSYFGLHAWIQRQLGKANNCIKCGTKNAKTYHWANISHMYKRNLVDWMSLCQSCHFRYDGVGKKAWITMRGGQGE